MTANRAGRIEKPRASGDGNEYHEAWTARKALQLLWPDSDLKAIAVEGPSPVDRIQASAATVEVADITMYFGGPPSFDQASRITFAQFKYSIADKDKDFRASDAKKTVEKFGKTYREYNEKYGVKAVQDKLGFQLITNRPISPAFLKAVDALAANTGCEGDVGKQAMQFQIASGLSGKPLTAFARKFKMLGRTGSLPATKNELASLLVDWSAASGDSIAAARLGKLKDLVRDKAGSAGTEQNLITRTDILAALQINDPKDLLPCESLLPDVGTILEREQLAEAMARVSQSVVPLLIQATGGVGKTVFMETLASKLAVNHEVIFFDCFGGGAYRSPEDARHLPKKGLIHIANTLAFRGLCDPMLPDNPDIQGLLRTFRRRLIQCLETLDRVTPGRKVALLIDAIDNADIVARRRSEDCFPVKLLESLDTEPIDGLRLIISCRPERKPSTYAKCEEFILRPFTKEETASFLRTRLSNPSRAEINVAQARSGGNPRVLDYLLKAGRGLLDPSEINNEIELDDLIQRRITDALASANERGYEQENIDAFLAGLAVLPPPVPLDEYAGAHGLALDAIESFASDLSPLLERTNQGLMFRDEPTETLIHKRYASSVTALRRVAANLLTRQDMSVYAARALPGLLHQLGDGEQLFALAFDDRIPSAITSTVGKRNVRYARLQAATLHAALKRDYNSLVRLLLELSTIAAVDQRGSNYIFEHPDLVVAAQDVDATRRLIEARTNWPGARHTRLAIANALSGEAEEAYRHAYTASEWIEHHRRTRHNNAHPEPGPERIDIAAIPFFLISDGRGGEAVRYLDRWRDWYTYEVCEHIFSCASLAHSINAWPKHYIDHFIGGLSSIGTLAATLSFRELTRAKRKDLAIALARRCRRATKLQLSDTYLRDHTIELQDGLRKSATIALSLGLSSEAMTISLRAPHKRPRLWAFRDAVYNRDVFHFLFRVALRSAAKNEPIHERDLLPQELVPICACIDKHLTGKEFAAKAKDRIEKYFNSKPKDKEQKTSVNSLSHGERQSVERFLNHRLGPLLGLTRALSTVLGAGSRRADKAFCELIEMWENSSRNRDPYCSGDAEHFFRLLGFNMALFVFWSRSEIKPLAAKRFLSAVNKQCPGAHNLVRIVAILAQRKDMRALAGEAAIQARTLIEKEDEVDSRASQFGTLSRAMLPASVDEASAYFREGLEQMDAIGSGDYQFTNELLLFASQIKGDELDEHDFHTLTNICELNMGGEPEKFFWGAYGRGISKVAGLRGLAKLGRWDDRSQITLKNTLLPYLTGLLEHGKIAPKDALALNRLANPVEYYYAGTKEFAEALRQQAGSDSVAIAELISQFQDDNPDMAMVDTVEKLAFLAKEAFGPASEVAKHLATAHMRYTKIRDIRNERSNYRGDTELKNRKESEKLNRTNNKALKRITAATDPIDEASLIDAIDKFNALGNMYSLKDGFFADLRKKVPYDGRAKYIRNIASLENLFFPWKFEELKEARKVWEGSSAALTNVYAKLAYQLLYDHAGYLIDDDRLSGSKISEIAELTSVAAADLIVELIKLIARPNSAVSGSLWLSFATFICSKADPGQGQLALTRLLSSESARLANNVVDGPWVTGLYPPEEFSEIASGLIWRVLGSPCAVDRWRAAHCLRSFARFGRWEILDKVVEKIGRVDAGSFQAKELPFFYMHARLWLLIALARIGRDLPAAIARYKDGLLSFVMEDENPHVLMRHFACRALLSCINAGHIKLPAKTAARIRTADRSTHCRLKKKIRKHGDFYCGRPDSAAKPSFRFHLDYDFHKHDVDNLSQVFGQPCWKVADHISEIVHRIDPMVEAMHDSSGRESYYRRTSYEITTRYHTHGQQLGWHALFLAAGRLLRDLPVTKDCGYYDDPWGEWLRRYGLTRDDGLWLSDGTDITPLDAAEFLLERKEQDLVLTGDQGKIMALTGLGSNVGRELVVYGRWFSADNVRIRITSALVPSQKAPMLAQKLAGEDPMAVWVPCLYESEEDSGFVRGDKKEYMPWIVCPSGEMRLDEHDPYGISDANIRPYLARKFAAVCSLHQEDPFGRVWKNKNGRSVLSVQAWGRQDKERDEQYAGTRLFCASTMLKQILSRHDQDLLILINLQRYEKGSYRQEGSTYTHSVAVVRVTPDLRLEYYKGCINHLHRTRY